MDHHYDVNYSKQGYIKRRGFGDISSAIKFAKIMQEKGRKIIAIERVEELRVPIDWEKTDD